MIDLPTLGTESGEEPASELARGLQLRLERRAIATSGRQRAIATSGRQRVNGSSIGERSWL